MLVRIVTTPPFLVRWYMDFFEYDGLATVWNTIYFRNEKVKTHGLLAHEKKHIEQMKREGKVKYLIKYHYYWIKSGYWNNPYEIEARQAEVGL